nr:MAG TPA: hypothetical protein [Caudoviricetes sp.]
MGYRKAPASLQGLFERRKYCTGKGFLNAIVYSHSGTQPVNRQPADENRQPSI